MASALASGKLSPHNAVAATSQSVARTRRGCVIGVRGLGGSERSDMTKGRAR